MEEGVISGHGKDSPGKHLSNLRLNGIDIKKKSNWRQHVMPRIIQMRIM